MSKQSGRMLWARWVLANCLGEVFGLGATFAVGVALFAGLSEMPGTPAAILSGLAMASTGVIEGVVVGTAQWWAMRRALSEIPHRAWVLATVLGAFVAWLLGSVPMTIASLSGSGQGAAAQEPEAVVMLALASGMGLVAGLVLGYPQWRVLRRFVEHGWLWLPANSLAWAVGMPVIFAGIDVAQRRGTVPGAVATMAVTLAVTGLAVGAIHGAALVELSGTGRAPAE